MKQSRNRLLPGLLPGLLLAAMGLTALADEQINSLDQDTQDLKQEIIELNRDLFILEEDLLFPANTQLTVFLSTDVGELFELDSVELRINGERVASHLYTAREADALRRGGVQRLHLGNLRSGEHLLEAVMVGKGPSGRDYRRGADLTFEKRQRPQYIELRIDDSTRKQQPEFDIKVWD